MHRARGFCREGGEGGEGKEKAVRQTALTAEENQNRLVKNVVRPVAVGLGYADRRADGIIYGTGCAKS